MTYRVCEDAPCCGCCGTNLYGTTPDSGYYDEPDYFLNEGVYRVDCDVCEDDLDYARDELGGCSDCGLGEM